MDVTQLKTSVLNTVKHLGNCKLTTDVRLYDDLKQYIDEMEDEAFQQDAESINASCNLLQTITKASDDNSQTQSLMGELKRESEIFFRSLRIYTKVKEYPYTPLQILLKLELLFDPLLDHSNVCHNTYFELSKNISRTMDAKLIESTILVEAKKRSMLFRELADAPLDDIIIFLNKYNKTFYDFYNYDKITYVVFRLRHLHSRVERSNSVYDKLCVFINSELKEKYQLNIESLIQLLLDQFECIDDGRYRKKLIEFVHNVYLQAYKIRKTGNPESDMASFYNDFDEPPFTFIKFFGYIKEDSVLTENDQNTFATLFEVYCKKLAGILPCASSQPPPEPVNSCEFVDSQSTKNAGNRRRNRRPRKTNRNIAAKEGKFSRYDATDNSVYPNTEDDCYSNQCDPSTTIPSHSLNTNDNLRYTSNTPRYHDKWNYYDDSNVHRPSRRNNKQQTWIDENY